MSIFPHYFLLPFLSRFASYRVRPLEPTMLPYDSKQFPPILQQDYANISIQQSGPHAEGFEYMRLAKGIEGLVGNFDGQIKDPGI